MASHPEPFSVLGHFPPPPSPAPLAAPICIYIPLYIYTYRYTHIFTFGHTYALSNSTARPSLVQHRPALTQRLPISNVVVYPN